MRNSLKRVEESLGKKLNTVVVIYNPEEKIMSRCGCGSTKKKKETKKKKK